MSSTDTSIFVGCLNQTAWVRIKGVATKDTSSGIRRYFSESLAEGLRNFIIDLEDCRCIDSTFIGILTGLAGDIADEGGGEVKVIHTNERNEKSICKLGLDNLITIDREGECAEGVEGSLNECLDLLEGEEDLEKSEKARMILKAHEDLCSANEDNLTEFGDVLKFLRQDLEQSGNS